MAYNLFPSLIVINFFILTGNHYKAANQLFDECLRTGNIEEKFQELYKVYNELNEASRLLSSSFESFLLASLSAQFMITLNLFFNLFLYIGGYIYLSTYYIIATLFWLVLQFSLVTGFVTGCERIRKEITRFHRILWHFNPSKISHYKKVLRVCIYKCQSIENVIVVFKVDFLQLLLIQGHFEFHAGKLFLINYGLMTMFFAALISYLIVIIQFHMQS